MTGLWKALALLALPAMLLMAVASAPLRAGDDDMSGSFLTPFPDNDVYQVAVFGDGFAEGLLAGLNQAFTADVRLNIQHQVVPFRGLNVQDFEARAATLEQTVAKMPLGIAVIMIGVEDRVPLRDANGKWLQVGTDPWLAEYTKRVDRIMRIFKRGTTGVYWVGLPTLGRADATDQAQRMNGVIRERAYLNGFKYIDAYQGFTDENGGYSPYGPDLDGAIRLLRWRDGVSFTDAGNRKLAHFVEKEMRPDLNQAKANRNIPLLGADAEQARINPGNAFKAPAPSSPVASQVPMRKTAPPVRGPSTDASSASTTTDASGDQKADNGKIALKVVGSNGREEVQTIEIVRPAIPASVVSLMARREGSGQRGDLLVDQIAGGLTLMSSITPSNSKDRAKLSPTQAPYFRLLVKGERLQPKPGRADDMTWPPKNDSTSDAKAGAAVPKG